MDNNMDINVDTNENTQLIGNTKRDYCKYILVSLLLIQFIVIIIMISINITQNKKYKEDIRNVAYSFNISGYNFIDNKTRKIKNTHNSRDNNRSLWCPPGVYGQWVSYGFCNGDDDDGVFNMGPNCSSKEILFQNLGQGNPVFKLCYNKCNKKRVCDVVTGNKGFYNIPAGYCTSVNIKCKSISVPIGTTVRAHFK